MRSTLKYFLPVAFRHYKGFFVLGILGIILNAVQPFVSIMMTPLILDELLGGRNLQKLFLYAAVIAASGSALSLGASVISILLEKYKEKMENFFTEEMSKRIMELDFQLTEDKKALDQIEAARTGMSWYSCLGNWKWQADRKLPLDMAKKLCYAAKDFVTYLYLGILVITGKITIGTFSQMLSAGSTLHDSMQGMIWNMQEIVKRTSYAYEYVKFMNYPPAIEKGEHPVADRPHTIEFRNVSFTFPNTDVKVLDNVNITLHPGEHLSVVGLNGAGKTTFIKLLCRLYDTTGGEILLDGVNIREYDYNEYMALFSPVFQDFKLFAFSMRENIILDNDCEEEALLSLTSQIGLNIKTDTILFKAFDENGVEPSGGEQQKIAIARSLFKKAPVVILDEPTAALDPVAEYDIYRHFDTLVGQKTAIYISHRLSSCRFCDRIAVFSEGRIMEYGTHEELVRKDGGIYAEMFAAQAQYYNA